MISRDDPYYAALLVEDARLHLGTVMEGQDSEPFFIAMLRIIEAKAHYGYVTLRNKEVELKGIKDFVHSVYYGLGVKNLNDFTLAVTKSALKERSKNRYAYKFIDWLRNEDACFQFSEDFFEYRRVRILIAKERRRKRFDRMMDYRTANYLYQVQPSLMVEIGPGRKYKTVQECYYAEGYGEKKQALKPIKMFRNPTVLQIEELGGILFDRFGVGRSRLLALNLLGHCADARNSGAGRSRVDGDPVATDDDGWSGGLDSPGSSWSTPAEGTTAPGSAP